MGRRAVSGMALALLFVGVLTLPFSIQPVKASEVHDVAVTAVETFKTSCGYIYPPIVYSCDPYIYSPNVYSVSIEITVENQGDFDETFDVTAKYDDNKTIQTILNVNLTAHTSTTVTFTWDTRGVAIGNYTISAMADTVPGETDTADNNCTDGWVVVTWLGDTDGDFDVDEDDLWWFCSGFLIFWKSCIIDPSTRDPHRDIDEDCDIDEDDLWAFCGGFIDYYKRK